MARAPRALVVLAALLLAACPRSKQDEGPVPVAVTPSEGTGLAALPVVILGDRFDASSQTDFSSGSGTLAATFQARLLPEGGGSAVALEGVRLTAERRLDATVPAGIGRGSYALEVTDPAGRVGSLPQAFRVYSAAENVVAFRVELAETAYAGVPFLVTLTAVDAAGTAVDGFTGQVTLSDTSGTVTPTTIGPFVRGIAQPRLTITALSAADQLRASDGAGHSGTSTAFAVSPGPPVALAFKSGPATVSAGACSQLVTVELRDALGNPSPALATVVVELQASPPGSLTFHVGGGACASPVTAISLPVGATTAAFRYTGPAPGAATIRTAPASLPSATFGITLTP